MVLIDVHWLSTHPEEPTMTCSATYEESIDVVLTARNALLEAEGQNCHQCSNSSQA